MNAKIRIAPRGEETALISGDADDVGEVGEGGGEVVARSEVSVVARLPLGCLLTRLEVTRGPHVRFDAVAFVPGGGDDAAGTKRGLTKAAAGRAPQTKVPTENAAVQRAFFIASVVSFCF
jgi:hypothetical protein